MWVWASKKLRTNDSRASMWTLSSRIMFRPVRFLGVDVLANLLLPSFQRSLQLVQGRSSRFDQSPASP